MADADINKYIRADPSQDPEGYLQELEPWDDTTAVERATQQGLTLNDDHWDVILYLRDRYRREGHPKSGRVLADELEERFSDKGGRRYLYTLFPHGPVTQGCELAGLPKPAYTTDPSFGYAE